MSWVRYDDELNYNRKITMLKGESMAGVAAIGLHLCLTAHARHQGTGGRIELGEINVIAGGSYGRRLVKMLLAVGMLDQLDDGAVAIHDCADYGSPDDPAGDVSAEDKRRSLSMKRAEAGRLGGKQRASNAQANSEATGQHRPTPVPVPVPRVTDTAPPPVSTVPAVGGVEPSIVNQIVLAAAGMLADKEPAGKITSRGAWTHSVAQRLLRDHRDWLTEFECMIPATLNVDSCAAELVRRAGGDSPDQSDALAKAGAVYGASVAEAQTEGEIIDANAFEDEIANRPQVWRDAARVAYHATLGTQPVDAEIIPLRRL